MSNKNREKPDFAEEIKLRERGYKFIAGVDEVGRGPLAGNITAAAVIFPANFQFSIFPPEADPAQWRDNFQEINDSKKLSAKKREKAYKLLTRNKKIIWSVASVSEKIIDKINIHKATQLAMLKAIRKLKIRPDFIIIDGNEFRNENFDGYGKKFIVKADAKTMSCAAASIIAKVTRDRLMARMHKKYPRYGFDKHKGYGTRKHFTALKKNGPCPLHRETFEPLKSLFQSLIKK
ncbi:MAG: ribonuclease HII [Parcubacteria group bacterium GW2011_GWA2_38_13b]|nr:MAG: ribonuclease HII [Parcubacteria group bacterium GW2011_GWA2_38_13b]